MLKDRSEFSALKRISLAAGELIPRRQDIYKSEKGNKK
ncbi:Uncharacterized protein dnm_087350 [Desulfonema magnum]|uniref:Uncharacterized protein n=1 Tax=Desulfonema magnum TaxID=45655 RepID=A0A975BVY8_9BACT|nr:Uncharacterized protein dnm_087350 [Desulfonema magnum]